MQHHPLVQPSLVLDPPTQWRLIKDAHPAGLALFERHYSCRDDRPADCKQFVGPGESLVLLTNNEKALCVWWKQRFRTDKQAGVNCAVFRNEQCGRLSSDLLLEAEQRAWQRWPEQRLFTFVDPRQVGQHNPSHNPGYCFKQAGWRACGLTKKGLLILEKLP